MSWSLACALWYESEGGDTLHEVPGDPGGLTKYGIAQRFNPGVNVAALTWDQAREILRHDYWVPNACDAIELVAPLTAWALFDFAANGNARAARVQLQHVAGVAPDGQIGPKTIEALRVANDLRTARQLTERRARRQIQNTLEAARARGRAPKMGDAPEKFLEGIVARCLRLTVALSDASVSAPSGAQGG